MPSVSSLPRRLVQREIETALAHLSSSSPQRFGTTTAQSFGGYPLRYELPRGEKEKKKFPTHDLWAQFLILQGMTQSTAYRVVSQQPLDLINPPGKLKLTLDTRPNIAHELETPTYTGSAELFTQYELIRTGKLDAVVSPIRWGALGAEFSPAAEHHREHRWDLVEEKNIGQALREQLAGNSPPPESFQNYVLAEAYQMLPHALFHEFTLGEIASLKMKHLTQQPVIPAFFSSENGGYSLTEQDQEILTEPESWEKEVRLPNGTVFHVEKYTAYPYPTHLGVVWCQLFRVWNAEHTEYQVVRTVETKLDSARQTIDGLRLDSNCTNGVHALDCHCDCGAQLWEVLRQGFALKKKYMVIQLDDHEGKGHGEVLKGATLHLQRALNPELKVRHENMVGNATTSGLIYDSLKKPHDLRTYDRGQAVMLALGIQEVGNALMGNNKKLDALTEVGVRYQTAIPVKIENVGEEARITLKEKHDNKVPGVTYLAQQTMAYR